MRRFKFLNITMLTLGTFCLSYTYAASTTLHSLTDDELSSTTGQALMSLSYISPKDAVNLESLRTGVSNPSAGGIGFYRLGMEAKLELNANIKKLQLGCGGVNGSGGCDIDFENVSLSGVKLDASGNPLPMTRAERASSSAVLTNPYLEFAIKNPNSASTREFVGVRLGSELANGLLTIGQNDGTVNGIKSLSGYMNIAPTTGTTQTAAGNLTQTITGRVNVGGCISGCPVGFTTDNKPLSIPSMPVSFNTKSSDVFGVRQTFATVGASAKVPSILLTDSSGSRTANMPGCFWVLIIPLCNYKINDLRINGSIENLYVDVNLEQSLGLIHSIPIKSPLSLSLQKQKILWPNAPLSPITNQYIAAEAGWWLAANDPIKLGALATAPGFTADISSAYPQVANIVSTYLYNNPLYVPFGDAVGSVFTSKLTANVNSINLNSYTNPAVGGNPVRVNLKDLPLGSAQDVTPNCYGGLNFC